MPEQSGDFLATPIPAEHAQGSIGAFKTVGDVIKGYSALSGKLGSRSMADADVPTDPAVRKSVLAKLGHAPPESADKYDLPDTPTAKSLRAWAHKHGLTVEQAKGLYGDMDADLKSIDGEIKGRIEKRSKDADDVMRKQWGAGYETENAAVKKALEWLFPEDVRNMLTATGAHMHPEALTKLNTIGKALTGGQFMSGGGDWGGGANDVAGKRAALHKFETDNKPFILSVNEINPEVKRIKGEWNKMRNEIAEMEIAAEKSAV